MCQDSRGALKNADGFLGFTFDLMNQKLHSWAQESVFLKSSSDGCGAEAFALELAFKSW